MTLTILRPHPGFIPNAEEVQAVAGKYGEGPLCLPVHGGTITPCRRSAQHVTVNEKWRGEDGAKKLD